MEKRAAILTCSSKGLGGTTNAIDTKITNSSIESMERELTNLGEYSFEIKSILKNKKFNVNNVSSALKKCKDADVVLFYYLGHGYPIEEEGGLALNYDEFKIDNLNDNFSIKGVINFAITHGVKKIILILDCCFSADADYQLNSFDKKVGYYLMAASTGYAYYNEKIGIFTRSLVLSLQEKNIPKKMVDASSQEVTFKSWFNYCKESIKKHQKAYEAGNLKLTLKPLEKTLPEKFNSLSPKKSLYRKLYNVLDIISNNKGITSSDFGDIIIKNENYFSSFEVSKDTELKKIQRIISTLTIKKYCNFCLELGFIANSGSSWELTNVGESCIGKDNKFNTLLVDSIKVYWSKHGIEYEDVWNVVLELLRDYEVPHTKHILFRLFKDKNFSINFREFRDTFVLLSFCGVFKRATYDTFFPAL